VKHFNQRLETAKQILQQLEKQPTQWTPLVKQTLQHSTLWITQSTLSWLRQEGYITRPKRGLYKITEKGETFLKAIH